MPLTRLGAYPLPRIVHYATHREDYAIPVPFRELVANQLRFFTRWRLAVLRERHRGVERTLPPTTFYVLSYKRPTNMRAIAGGLLALRCAKRVVIINNNPEVDLGAYLPRDRRLELVQGTGAIGYRYVVASDLGDERIAFCDDDVFVMPDVWRRMIATFDKYPEAPVGLLGVLFIESGDAYRHPSLPDIGVDFGEASRNWMQVASEGVTDLVSAGISVASVGQARRILELAKEFGVDMAHTSVSDDLFLAHSGTRRPRTVGVNPITDFEFCLSSAYTPVAISQGGAGDAREKSLDVYYQERFDRFMALAARCNFPDPEAIQRRRDEVIRLPKKPAAAGA